METVSEKTIAAAKRAAAIAEKEKYKKGFWLLPEWHTEHHIRQAVGRCASICPYEKMDKFAQVGNIA